MSGEADAAPDNVLSQLEEVLPKAGLVYSEKGTIGEVLCKPKIIPIKSVSLEALEAMLKAASSANAADDGSNDQ
jgi:hypothetical protein